MTTGEMWVRDADQYVSSGSNIFHTDRFAVGQNVATTWTFKRMPPSRDAPEFKRHIMGWFDEVCMYESCIDYQLTMLGEQVQVEIS